MTGYKGIAASPGIAIGRVQVYRAVEPEVVQRTVPDSDAEARRFLEAVQAAIGELEEIVARLSVQGNCEQVQILEAHQMILQDPEFAHSIEQNIRETSLNAEAALKTKTDELVQMFEAMDNDYMRQRAADIRDISGRVLAKLYGVGYGVQIGDAQDVILVAEDLHPSDTIQLDLTRVRGFVTDIGGRTSHTAIMARTRGIPAVVGTGSLSKNVHEQEIVIVDGETGDVFINPSSEQLSLYETKSRQFEQRQTELLTLRDEKSETLDGHRIELAANIGVPEEAVIGMEHGAEGVGLFRSEFLFMNRQDVPFEEEQFEAYRQAAVALKGRPLIIRTMDIGGDKSIDYMNLPHELNPFLGYRAIRISLDRLELFRTQLRAILRASHYGQVKVMYPMIATLDEVHLAKEVMESVKAELQAQEIPFNENIEQGIMVEIPAAAIAADLIAPEVDFFSIGTNDLIQYTMACDRMNEKVSYLYQPYHPSVLRLVKMVIDAAHQHGKWVGMCGEMAGDLAIVPVLIGLGIDELSMSPMSILPVRKVVRSSERKELEHLAIQAIALSTSNAVQELMKAYFDGK